MSKATPKSRWVFAISIIVALLLSIGSYRWFTVEHTSPTTNSEANRALDVSVSLQIIHGSISSSKEAIVGSQVCIYGADEKNKLDKECAQSDGLGAYSIRLPPGNYTATASADGFFSDTRSVSVNATTNVTQLDFILQAATPTLAGFVHDGIGHVVASANIAVYQDNTLVSNTSTDAHGHFSAWAPKGAVALSVTAVGYQDARVQSFAPTTDILVTLLAGFSVSGQVLKAHTGQAVAHIRVTVTQSAAGIVDILDKSVITDAKGRFAFKGLPIGKNVFGVNAKHLSGRTVTSLTSQAHNDSVTIIVREGQEVAGRFLIAPENTPCKKGDLELVPQELFDSNGNIDLSQTFVAESTTDNAKSSAIAITINKDGIVELPAVPAGQYAVFAGCPEHQLVSGPSRLEVGVRDIENQEWKFERGLSIELHVVDASNHSLESTDVFLKPMVASMPPIAVAKADPARYATRTGRTDTQGIYRFGNILPGKYEVTAQGGAITSSVQATQKVEVQAGMNQQQITLTLPLLGTIEIYTHTPNNQPISRLMFYATDRSGKRFEAKYIGDGRYAVGPLPQEQYQVMAYDNKNPKEIVSGPADEWLRIDSAQPVKLDFQYESPQGIITGTVRDSTGSPLIAAVQAVSTTLDAEDERYADMQATHSGEQYRTTDEQGNFQLDGLQSNASYRIFVESRSGQKVERKNVSPGDFVQIELPALASISGKLVTASGAPASDFIVIAENSELGDRQAKTYKKSDGTFKLEGINPGTIEFTAISQDTHQQATTTLKLAPGEARTSVQLVIATPPTGDE